MAALWSFGTVQIFVDENDITREVYRAEIKVLDATSATLHYFGAGSTKHTVQGLVIGDTNKNQLITWAIGDTAQTFTSDQGSQGSFRINGTPKFSRVKFAGANIDGTDYTVSTAIYRCELELIAA